MNILGSLIRLAPVLSAAIHLFGKKTEKVHEKVPVPALKKPVARHRRRRLAERPTSRTIRVAKWRTREVADTFCTLRMP